MYMNRWVRRLSRRPTWRLFQAMFQSAADVIVVVDEQGSIVMANDACERLLGHRRPHARPCDRGR